MIIKKIENNSIAEEISHIENNRLKGHIRQVEIIKFLTIWKYATKRQLAFLVGETPENVSKHINRLKRLGYIKTHKHQGYTIVEITNKALELIEDLTGIEYEFFKSKDRWDKEYIEHDLILRTKAIQMMNPIQLPVKTSLYFRKIYKYLKNKYNENHAKKTVRKLHIADFIVLKDMSFLDDEEEDEDKIIVVGIEYENTRKKIKDLKRKIKSMKESIGYYSQYMFLAKNTNILKGLPDKILKASKDVDYNLSVMKISNLLPDENDNYDFLNIKYYNHLNDIAKKCALELSKDINKLNKIFEIPALSKTSI